MVFGGIAPIPGTVYAHINCERARLERTEIMGGVSTLGHSSTSYSLVAENLVVNGELVAKKLTIPLSEEQYHTLKDQYENSEAEEKTFELEGELELTLRSVCIN